MVRLEQPLLLLLLLLASSACGQGEFEPVNGKRMCPVKESSEGDC